jgi:hypothetical protein
VLVQQENDNLTAGLEPFTQLMQAHGAPLQEYALPSGLAKEVFHSLQVLCKATLVEGFVSIFWIGAQRQRAKCDA